MPPAAIASVWTGLLACAHIVSTQWLGSRLLPPRLQPDPAEALMATLVFLTALGSLLVWNAPYAGLFYLRAQGYKTRFDRYLIQPPSSSAAGSKGQTTRWAEFARAATTMPTQLLFLWAVLCWGTGSRVILHYRPEWRAALDGYIAGQAAAKGVSTAAGAAAAALAIPAWRQQLWEVWICLLVEDASFYWLHRLLHHPKLYAAVHKAHHYYKAPFSLCATYTSLLDFALGNSVPITLGVILACSSLFSVNACLCARLFLTTEIHSGYAFPWSVDTLLRRLLCSGETDWLYAGSRHHDAHHEKTHGNYGSSFVFWDYLCGTHIAPAGETNMKKKSL